MKKYFFPLLLCHLVLANINPVAAQSKKQVKDSSVTIIFQETQAASSTKKKKASSENNIIKIAPLGFIAGQFPLVYERRLTDYLTLQAGAGLTNRNYIRGAMASAYADMDEGTYPWSDYNYGDQADDLYDFDSRTVKNGFMYTVEPRIYFESDAPDGSFLGLSYTNSKYNFEIPAIQKNSNGDYVHKGAPVKEFENIKDLMVNFGWQNMYDRISLEYIICIGLRKINGEKYVYQTDYNNNKVFEGMQPYKESKINFSLGLKVGFHF